MDNDDVIDHIRLLVKQDVNLFACLCFRHVWLQCTFTDNLSMQTVDSIVSLLTKLVRYTYFQQRMSFTKHSKRCLYRITDILYQTYERHHSHDCLYLEMIVTCDTLCEYVRRCEI